MKYAALIILFMSAVCYAEEVVISTFTLKDGTSVPVAYQTNLGDEYLVKTSAGEWRKIKTDSIEEIKAVATAPVLTAAKVQIAESDQKLKAFIYAENTGNLDNKKLDGIGAVTDILKRFTPHIGQMTASADSELQHEFLRCFENIIKRALTARHWDDKEIVKWTETNTRMVRVYLDIVEKRKSVTIKP